MFQLGLCDFSGVEILDCSLTKNEILIWLHTILHQAKQLKKLDLYPCLSYENTFSALELLSGREPLLELNLTFESEESKFTIEKLVSIVTPLA